MRKDDEALEISISYLSLEPVGQPEIHSETLSLKKKKKTSKE
jgi:hypothetical protein